MTDITPDDLEAGAPAFKFHTPGDTITGTITAARKVQATDYDTGEPVTWPNGDPKYDYPITVTNPDGEQTVWCRNQMWVAVRDACTKTGSIPQPGGVLTVTYTGDGEKSNPKYNAPKLYTATYQPAPPAQTGAAISTDDF